ncbi:hypothetical protein [Desulfocicer niacini]|jgi:hypothetical protein
MDKKKLAAATAAVFTYIKTQEEAAFFASGGAPVEETAPKVPAPAPVMFNAWGTAGRTDQMQGRFLMQTRVFR